MKAIIISLALIFFGISSYSQSDADKRKAILSMQGGVADDRPVTYPAKYRGKKNDLERHINSRITVFVVDYIKNNSDETKFIGVDTLSFYFRLSVRGDIESIDKVSATFPLTEENKIFLSNQIIGMQNWKPQKNRSNIVYLWRIPFKWV